MKKLNDDEANFLFEWVKNWYPTEAKTKIAILLLNKQEWRDLYMQIPVTSSEEFKKRLDEKIKELPEKIQNLLKQIEKLSEDQKKQLMKTIIPHFDEREENIDYWMNETAGKCFSTKKLEDLAEILKQDSPAFFKPYMNYDFIIIVSDFFSKEQKKKLNSKHMRNIVIYSTIFHELIHVIEHCTGTRIFKTDSLQESMPITLHLAKKYFEEY